MTIRRAYAFYKEIRLEIIMGGKHIQTAEALAAESGFAKRPAAWAKSLALTRGRRASMREWQKPTIDETESGMEVTSYLPAELDRA
jgi:coenzyme PQQ precursor peptide PqqA